MSLRSLRRGQRQSRVVRNVMKTDLAQEVPELATRCGYAHAQLMPEIGRPQHASQTDWQSSRATAEDYECFGSINSPTAARA